MCFAICFIVGLVTAEAWSNGIRDAEKPNLNGGADARKVSGARPRLNPTGQSAAETPAASRRKPKTMGGADAGKVSGGPAKVDLRTQNPKALLGRRESRTN